MSRIGKKPIPVPKGVTLTVNGMHIVVQGPKGKLERDLPPFVDVKVEDGKANVLMVSQEREANAMHGLARALINNMINGVVNPFKKSLEITGVGYRADLKGSELNLQVGLSHEVNHPIPAGVTCQVEKQTVVHLESCDRDLVGRVAAEIKAYRPC